MPRTIRRRTAAFAVASLAATTSITGISASSSAAVSADLFISEYIEGSSNNKALEFFNGTGATVDLVAGGYQVEMYFNGSTTPGLTHALTGSVADGDVHVLANPLAGPDILAVADETTASSAWFNGDDAVVLRRGGGTGPILDVIGQVGLDPGSEWGSGLLSTQDNTLVRQPTVEDGDTDPSDSFDPASQWVGFPIDTFGNLGSHSTGGSGDPTITCPTLSGVEGFPADTTVTADDPDGTIVDIVAGPPAPDPSPGTITLTSFTPGDPATATITADAAVPAGTYTVPVTATAEDGGSAACTLAVTIRPVQSIGTVQGAVADDADGSTHASPFVGQRVATRGVVTQLTRARESDGDEQYGFFLQSTLSIADGDPNTSDGIFVFQGRFPDLIGGYIPIAGDEIVIDANVTEFFNLTELTSATALAVLREGVEIPAEAPAFEVAPPVDLDDAERYWERREGMQGTVVAGSLVTGARDVFSSTFDSEVWVIRPDDPLAQRDDPYARRVFRDAHPLDNDPATFDDGNGNRILIGPLGVKGEAGDSTLLLPPARQFDTLAGDATGGVFFSFGKYRVEATPVAFTGGSTDPALNSPPQAFDRSLEYSAATFNLENLYDFRDDPTDGCDFADDPGCEGVSPPFDYMPASAVEYETRLGQLADQIAAELHAPDLLLVQEAEDQDVCSVVAGTLDCGALDQPDGRPDTLQELALEIAESDGPVYEVANDRDGADDRGIVSGFMWRIDRVELLPASEDDPVLGSAPTVEYRTDPADYNNDVSNPKVLNAVLPEDADDGTGTDGDQVFTRPPQVGLFRVHAEAGSPVYVDLYALSNHFSSGPDSRVSQRREQAVYNAAIVDALQGADADVRAVVGGDLNVFPRPDDPFTPGDDLFPSDQLAALYDQGLSNLYDSLLAEEPQAAYSYVFEGQAQTLDQLFVTPSLFSDLVEMRAAHVNADYPVDESGDGPRGTSDHDPQVARFATAQGLVVEDLTVVEGTGGSRRVSVTVRLGHVEDEEVCASWQTEEGTATAGRDFKDGEGEVCISAGETSATIEVKIKSDRTPEADEFFTVSLFDAAGADLFDPTATVTITNDD